MYGSHLCFPAQQAQSSAWLSYPLFQPKNSPICFAADHSSIVATFLSFALGLHCFVRGNWELKQLLSLEGDSRCLMGTEDFYLCMQILYHVVFTCTKYTHTRLYNKYLRELKKKAELRSLQERGRDLQIEDDTVRWGGITHLHNFHCLLETAPVSGHTVGERFPVQEQHSQSHTFPYLKLQMSLPAHATVDESSWSNSESTSTSCNLFLIPHLHVLHFINNNEPNTLALHIPANISAKGYAKKRVQKS